MDAAGREAQGPEEGPIDPGDEDYTADVFVGRREP